MLLHAHRQRLDPAQHQPTVERIQDGAGGFLNEVEPVVVLLPRQDDRPADGVAVPVEELGSGMHHHVGAELQRALQVGAHEGVVHHQHELVGARNPLHLFQVAEGHGGVGGRLHVEQAGILLDGCLHRGSARGIHEAGFQPKARQHLREQPVHPAVHRVRANHVVTALEQRHDGVDGGHARGKRQRVAPAFQLGQVALQGRPGGVARPGVVVALVLAQLLLHVGGGLVDGDDDGARGRVRLLADVNGIGGEAHVDSFSSRQSDAAAGLFRL